MSPFNIEHQYQAYLKRMALDERTMHREQKRQLRQTFFGAWGQLLICMQEDVAELPELQAVATFESMKMQVQHFFEVEVDKHKARNN